MSADDARIYGRGISFPPRLGPDGRMAWSSGPENVRESLLVMLRTERGERLRSTFGSQLGGSILFEPNTVATRRRIQEEMETTIRTWEPRVRLESVTVEADETEPQGAIATVRYRLTATSVEDQVGFRIQLAG